VHPDGFVSAMRDAVRDTGADVLLPITEPSLLAVLPERSGISASIPFTSASDFERICDKDAVLDAARTIGIAVPAQRVANSADEVRDGALAYPIVLKPSRSVVGEPGKRSKASVLYAAKPGELEGALGRLRSDAYPVLVQQRIHGPGIAHSALLWDGEVKAAFAHQRIREKPPSGGVSVLRESIALDPALLARSVALLRHFQWQGVAMVEYKVDASTGEPYLMEINGRLWGSLQLAIDSGVDFPALLVACALGEKPEPVLEYRVGVRTWWEWGDVDHLLARLRHSPERLALAGHVPGRASAVRDFLGTFGSRSIPEVFRRDDLRPFLRETLNWLRRR
jgi:predicted ATP-grasp superfamily ATP-dependent carboligase